jgi:hypothetical protein
MTARKHGRKPGVATTRGFRQTRCRLRMTKWHARVAGKNAFLIELRCGAELSFSPDHRSLRIVRGLDRSLTDPRAAQRYFLVGSMSPKFTRVCQQQNPRVHQLSRSSFTREHDLFLAIALLLRQRNPILDHERTPFLSWSPAIFAKGSESQLMCQSKCGRLLEYGADAARDAGAIPAASTLPQTVNW